MVGVLVPCGLTRTTREYRAPELPCTALVLCETLEVERLESVECLPSVVEVKGADAKDSTNGPNIPILNAVLQRLVYNHLLEM